MIWLHHVRSDWAAPGDQVVLSQCAVSAQCLVFITASLSQMKNECPRKLTCYSPNILHISSSTFSTELDKDKCQEFPLKIINKIVLVS